MNEIADRFRTRAAEFTGRVVAVPAERWDDPSPCAGWTVRDVVRHMIENLTRTPTFIGLSLELTASVDDDPVVAWTEARDAMQALLADQRNMAREYDGYFGRTTFGATIDQFVGFDLVIHAWDIARATGQDETLPPDEVRLAHATALGFGDNLRLDGVCGPEVPVPADAPEQDRLLALLGRTP